MVYFETRLSRTELSWEIMKRIVPVIQAIRVNEISIVQWFVT